MNSRPLTALKILSLASMLLGLRVDPAIAQEASKPSKNSLKSLYIVAEAVSDASPFWFKYVLDVSPSDQGLSATWIRIAPLSNGCPGVTVKAMTEAVRKPLANVTTPNLCSVSVSKIEKAIADAPRKSSIWDTVGFGIVADCGSETRVFRLPLGDLVDMDRLKQRSSEAASLYDLYSRLVRETFKEKGFYKNTPEVDRDLQQAGNFSLGDLQQVNTTKGFPGITYLQTRSKPSSATIAGFDVIQIRVTWRGGRKLTTLRRKPWRNTLRRFTRPWRSQPLFKGQSNSSSTLMKADRFRM